MSNLFLEKSSIKSAGVPADITGGFTGARVSLAKGYKLAIVCHFGDSVGATVTPSLIQHDAASGGVSKALNIQTNYYTKLDSELAFTKVEVRADDAGLSDSALLSARFAADEGIAVFEVLPEHLDVNGDFDHVSLDFAAAGAAKITSVQYVVRDIQNGLGYEAEL